MVKGLRDKDTTKSKRNYDRLVRLGLGAIHDASFMQQPGEGSQFGYAIMLAPVTLYDEPTVTHLLDWNSAKIHRKVRSTLAAEASGASCAPRGAARAQTLPRLSVGTTG